LRDDKYDLYAGGSRKYLKTYQKIELKLQHHFNNIDRCCIINIVAVIPEKKSECMVMSEKTIVFDGTYVFLCKLI
jgi:hypothetical protein